MDGYDNIKKWFRIEYTDDDTEEMSRTELKKSINDFQQQCKHASGIDLEVVWKASGYTKFGQQSP
eukprot:7096-Heterococcus_DN1.PRE.1